MRRPVSIVTGGSRGIGAACCRMLAARGHDIAFSYRSNEGAAEALVAAIEANGVAALPVKADMGTEDGVMALFNAVDSQFGAPDNVVINAGITGKITRVADIKAAEIQTVMDVNVVGALLSARESVRRLSTDLGGKGGNIVIVSSIASTLGAPHEFVHYAASKGATDSLTIGLAKEVAREGIRVNAVAPGLIDTDIHATAGAPDRIQRLQSMVPIGRGGTAEEVAEAILWLMTEEARYVTGAILPVTGGR